jgi:isoleucyl-tRNA synthetase
MDYAQRISSLVLSLRKAESLRVRQPLKRILLPVLDSEFQAQVDAVKELILAEVNIKEIEYITDTQGIIKKRAKPNFKTLGRKLGKDMKAGNQLIQDFDQETIAQIERDNHYELLVGENKYSLTLEDIDILSEDIPGWQVASDRGLTVALDISLDEALLAEGMARELVNRIQNIRKDSGLEVTDRIIVTMEEKASIKDAVSMFGDYIANEVLADGVKTEDTVNGQEVELLDGEVIHIKVSKA